MKIRIAQGENASCSKGGGEIAGGGDGAGESAGCRKVNRKTSLRGEQVTRYCDERRHFRGCCSFITESTVQHKDVPGFLCFYVLSSRDAYFAECHNYEHILCNKGTLPGFVTADRIYDNCSYHLILDQGVH